MRRDDPHHLRIPNVLRGGSLAVGPEPRRTVVFDKARSANANPEVNAGLGVFNHSLFGAFRTTERDKLPAREVVTARLLGDPAPGRPQPIEPTIAPERICTDSGPVLLTFGEYRRHYGEG